MPENTDAPRDYGDALHDEDRADAVRVVLQALRESWLVPPTSGHAESDYGSSAGLVFDRLQEAGFRIIRDVR